MGPACENHAVTRRTGAMHIETARSHQTLKDGTERVYQRHLLRRSYRQGGKVRKQTLANLSHLPYALLVSRVVRPRSKLSTIGWWDDVTLGADLGVAGASTDEVYQAMDWLVGRHDHIEAELARRHLQAGGIAMIDLSSSWMEGSHCELACFGHSRDGKRGKPKIEYGLLCDPAGRPVAVRVFAGNTADPTAFTQAVEVVRGSFDLRRLILVGDRGMITSARIGDLRATPGMAWITALRAPTVKQLAQDGGPLQLGLFDQTDLAEICSPDYPGERLVACRNPLLATERARKRADLLAATEALLAKVKQQVDAGRLRDPDKIGVKADRALRKHKVAKHLVVQVAQGSISWHRDQAGIDAEAALDGIYVIRTSVPAQTLDAPATVAAYKNLAFVERDFRHIKADDLDLRPIWHRLADRVRDLLDHLATLTRDTITISGRTVDKLTTPTQLQRRAFDLLNTPIPINLT